MSSSHRSLSSSSTFIASGDKRPRTSGKEISTRTKSARPTWKDNLLPRFETAPESLFPEQAIPVQQASTQVVPHSTTSSELQCGNALSSKPVENFILFFDAEAGPGETIVYSLPYTPKVIERIVRMTPYKAPFPERLVRQGNDNFKCTFLAFKNLLSPFKYFYEKVTEDFVVKLCIKNKVEYVHTDTSFSFEFRDIPKIFRNITWLKFQGMNLTGCKMSEDKCIDYDTMEKVYTSKLLLVAGKPMMYGYVPWHTVAINLENRRGIIYDAMEPKIAYIFDKETASNILKFPLLGFQVILSGTLKKW